MFDEPIPTINRAALAVTPKQPYVDWANSFCGPDDPKLPLKEFQDDGTVYLIPETADDHEDIEVIREVFEDVFCAELAAWWTDEADWPEITWKRFNEWFAYDYRSIVMDLAAFPLERDA